MVIDARLVALPRRTTWKRAESAWRELTNQCAAKPNPRVCALLATSTKRREIITTSLGQLFQKSRQKTTFWHSTVLLRPFCWVGSRGFGIRYVCNLTVQPLTFSLRLDSCSDVGPRTRKISSVWPDAPSKTRFMQCGRHSKLHPVSHTWLDASASSVAPLRSGQDSTITYHACHACFKTTVVAMLARTVLPAPTRSDKHCGNSPTRPPALLPSSLAAAHRGRVP